MFDSDDTVSDGKAVKSSRRRGSNSSRTGKGSSSCDGEGLAGRKKAQCLCIYAPRRGILEVGIQRCHNDVMDDLKKMLINFYGTWIGLHWKGCVANMKTSPIAHVFNVACF